MNKEEIQNKYIDLRQGDCLEIMKEIPDKSIEIEFCVGLVLNSFEAFNQGT